MSVGGLIPPPTAYLPRPPPTALQTRAATAAPAARAFCVGLKLVGQLIRFHIFAHGPNETLDVDVIPGLKVRDLFRRCRCEVQQAIIDGGIKHR